MITTGSLQKVCGIQEGLGGAIKGFAKGLFKGGSDAVQTHLNRTINDPRMRLPARVLSGLATPAAAGFIGGASAARGAIAGWNNKSDEEIDKSIMTIPNLYKRANESEMKTLAKMKNPKSFAQKLIWSFPNSEVIPPKKKKK